MLIINFRYIDAAHRIKLYKSQTFLISNEIQLNQYTVLYPIYYIILQNTHGTYEIRSISRENKSFLICLKIIFIFIFIFISLSLSKKKRISTIDYIQEALAPSDAYFRNVLSFASSSSFAPCISRTWPLNSYSRVLKTISTKFSRPISSRSSLALSLSRFLGPFLSRSTALLMLLLITMFDYRFFFLSSSSSSSRCFCFCFCFRCWEYYLSDAICYISRKFFPPKG